MTAQPLIRPTEAVPPLYLGVDVGGTSIKFGVVDQEGRTVAFDRIPTEPRRPASEAVARLGRAVERLLAERGVDPQAIVAVGLGSPGTMDIGRGMLLEPPNLYAWHQFPLRDAVAERLGRPVAFANDGAAAAYGEFWLGTGREDDSIVMLTLGTGVGGGIIYQGVSLDGQHSHGSECGHVIIDTRPEARVCSCGQAGHLEAYASATALVERTREALGAGHSSSIAARLECEELTALLIAEEAGSGDSLARELVMETADYLAIGITSLVHTIDPSAVILGGAMNFGGSEDPLGAEFLARTQAEFRRRTFPVLAQDVRIKFAQLGGDAGYLGAAGLARAAFTAEA